MNVDEIYPLIQCPVSGLPLKRDGEVLATEGTPKIEYRIIKGYPVLVDFESSVITENQVGKLSSAVPRGQYSGVLSIFQRLAMSSRHKTKKNINCLIDAILAENDTATILIVGGGGRGKGASELFEHPKVRIVSFDIYASPNVQFVADAHRIPLADESFDAVIIQAVLEHVLEPVKVVSEMYRVLHFGGWIYAETPFLQHVHEGAYDFTRFTESGHRYLFRNFKVVQTGATSGAGTQLLWSVDNFWRGVFRSRRVGRFVKLLFFWLKFCDKIIPESYNIDSASEVYLLGKKSATTLRPLEAVSHYKGAQ